MTFITRTYLYNPHHLFYAAGTYIPEYGKTFRITFNIPDGIVFDSREDN